MSREEHPFWGAGFGSPGSIVHFPLSRRALLHGGRPTPGATLEPKVGAMVLDKGEVAAVNTETIVRAPQHVFTGDPEIVWMLGEALADRERLLQFCHDHRIKNPRPKKRA